MVIDKFFFNFCLPSLRCYMARAKISELDLNILLKENQNLKEEVSSLRNQIDRLQERSNELRHQKKDLEGTVVKLAQSKAEIEELQKQKDDLFAVLIHDIKNPAGIIKNLVELLTNYNLNANEQKEIIGDIYKTTSMIVSLSQDISRVMALEAGKLQMHYGTHDINEILQDVYLRYIAIAEDKNIQIINQATKNITPLYLDRYKIEEVFENLVSNAIKFTHPGGKVMIRANVEGSHVVVEIIDTGLGLSQDDIQNAFKRGSKPPTNPPGQKLQQDSACGLSKNSLMLTADKLWSKVFLIKDLTSL